jgi:hypothetical protein
VSPAGATSRHRHASLGAAAHSTCLDHDTPLMVPESFAAEMASSRVRTVDMDAELLKLGMHGTCGVDELPEGRKTVGSKWVYKGKRDSKGNTHR